MGYPHFIDKETNTMGQGNLARVMVPKLERDRNLNPRKLDSGAGPCKHYELLPPRSG